MSDLSHHFSNSSLRCLIVFDTPAILAVHPQKAEKEWLNNFQLGECYIPDEALDELWRFYHQGHKKAKNFIRFQQNKKAYQVIKLPGNCGVPIPENMNSRNRAILNSTFNLAKQWCNSLVILVTYENIAEQLNKQPKIEKLVPNFCVLTLAQMRQWCEQQQPPEVVDKILQHQGKTQAKVKKYYHSQALSKNTAVVAGITKKQTVISVPSLPLLLPPDDSKLKHQQWLLAKWNIWVLSISVIVLSAIIITFLELGNRDPLTVLEQVFSQVIAVTPKIEETPATLIAQAEAGIIKFQKTKAPSALRSPLNALQSLKNKQNNRLDLLGEQSLSRLKHKYAIEVLASSGQTQEAIGMLQEIHPSYSDFSKVQNWLAQHHE